MHPEVSNIFREGDFPAFLGSLFQFCHPQSNEASPRIQMELSVFQFVYLASFPATGHYWKESGPILLKLEVWAVDPPECIWSELSKSFLATLISHSFFALSCSSGTCCWGISSTWAHLLQAPLLPVPAPGERSRHFLHSEVCTGASLLSSSVWTEAPRLQWFKF